jgi:hypothetical protein
MPHEYNQQGVHRTAQSQSVPGHTPLSQNLLKLDMSVHTDGIVATTPTGGASLEVVSFNNIDRVSSDSFPGYTYLSELLRITLPVIRGARVLRLLTGRESENSHAIWETAYV